MLISDKASECWSCLQFSLRIKGRVGFLSIEVTSASAPFVATLVDVTGLVIYFTIAKVILTGTLL